ncbi:MAG: hypothetical protein J5649_07525 [Lachnospiraceae bacterium]|nr:hypothetical protein [Lachnospiraceae bacterium]
MIHAILTIDDIASANTPVNGAPLLVDPGSHILLLHAHDETDEMVPGYYRLFIERLLENGVIFDVPEFITL